MSAGRFFPCYKLINSMLMFWNIRMFIIKYICLKLQDFPF